MGHKAAAETFLTVLFIAVLVIAIGSRGALKGPDAFVLRWTVLSLAVVFSALVAWVRWKLVQPRTTPSTSPSSTPAQPRQPPARIDAAGPSPDVAAAARQAVLFRQHFPPRHDTSTLSFFGGTPIAPAGFRWPRPVVGGAEGKPFAFLMQIDCAEIPAPARLRMLPDRGVLYFFLDLTWGQTDAFRVLYEEAGKDWKPVQPPQDLGPAFGDQAVSVWHWTQSVKDCPQLLPKWTFQPVAIEIPRNDSAPTDPEEADFPLLWPGETATAEILKRAQGEEVVSDSFGPQNLIEPDGSMRRPFAGYPHDWRAIQVFSGLLLGRLRHERHVPGIAALRQLSDAERSALVSRLREEAQRWFERAASQAPFAAVPPEESDRFWSSVSNQAWLIRFVIRDAMTISIEESLGASAEAAARVPAEVARRVHSRHALAVRHEQKLYASTPDRMLAAPVDVQGHQWDRAKTHLLLLELSSNEGLGHHFGEGVYQFWIAPGDLKARRFDQVVLTSDAY